jgi:hypothetical protein
VVANAVTWLYCCHHYRDVTGGTMVFTGDPLDVFMAGEMYSYLIKTIERIARKAIRKNAKLKFRRDFKYGMASRLKERVYSLGGTCSWAPGRMSKIAAVTEYVEKREPLKDGKRNNKKTKLNTSAYTRGSLYADNVSLARQTGYSGSPVPRLPGRERRVTQGELF